MLQPRYDYARGLHLIFQGATAVYGAKANQAADRLGQHREKLRARQGIDIEVIGFKALLLDENWSTSANEKLLIGRLKKRGECNWNGSGFGPKDPGKQRDTTKPSWFDNAFPIRNEWPVENLPDEATVGEVLKSLKDQLPFLLRYDKLGKAGVKTVNLTGVQRSARAVLLKCAQALGAGWQLTLLKYGFILYPGLKKFTYGKRLHP